MKVLDGLREEIQVRPGGPLPPLLAYLNSHLGYDWLVHECIPPLLQLIQGEVTGELDTTKDGDQVVSLK